MERLNELLYKNSMKMDIKYTVYDIKYMLKLMLVKLTTHLFLSCVFKVLSCLAAKHFLFVLTEFI